MRDVLAPVLVFAIVGTILFYIGYREGYRAGRKRKLSEREFRDLTRK